VLIEVAYAGVNFAEVQHRRGEFGEPDGPGGYDVPGLEVWKNNKTVAGYNIGDVARRSPATIGEHLSRALSALASGELPYTPPTVVPSSDVVEVHRRHEAGRTHGKTVLAFTGHGAG
jgi:NADPH2:quinone reductase